jgi:hypothetical protein
MTSEFAEQQPAIQANWAEDEEQMRLSITVDHAIAKMIFHQGLAQTLQATTTCVELAASSTSNPVRSAGVETAQCIEENQQSLQALRAASAVVMANKLIASKSLEAIVERDLGESMTPDKFMKWCTSCHSTVEACVTSAVQQRCALLAKATSDMTDVLEKFGSDSRQKDAENIKTKYHKLTTHRSSCRDFLAAVAVNVDCQEVVAAQGCLDDAEAKSTMWGTVQILGRKHLEHKDKGKENRDNIRKIYETRVKGHQHVEKVFPEEIMQKMMKLVSYKEEEEEKAAAAPAAKKAKKGKS